MRQSHHLPWPAARGRMGLTGGRRRNQSFFYQTYLPDGGFCCATASGGQCYDPLGNPIYSPCPSLYTCDGSPPPGDPHGLCTHPKEEWFALPATQALLARYKKWLIINVVGEDAPDDDLAWYRLAVSQINFYRDAGYTEPLSFLPGTYGRKRPIRCTTFCSIGKRIGAR